MPKANLRDEQATILDPRESIMLLPGYDPYRDAGDCWFDAEEAYRRIEFFHECLHLTEGVEPDFDGKLPAFILEPWLQGITANIFGWKRPNGLRRYRTVFIYVPRKNAKTPFAAGLVLCVGQLDEETGAQIYSAAWEREQASLIYRHAKQMVDEEPMVFGCVKEYKTMKTLEWQDSRRVFYRALSSEAQSKHGYNSSCIVLDELHVFGPNRDLIEALKTSRASRKEPLFVYTTTADIVRESVCNEEYEYAKAVRDGTIEDPYYLPVIYELTLEDADAKHETENGECFGWQMPELWRKANPMYGISVQPEYLHEECERAKHSIANENSFKRLHLNIRTQQVSRWLSMDRWDGCTDIDDPVAWREAELERRHGEQCMAGLDLGASGDLTALVLAFRDDSHAYTLIPWFWLPRNPLETKEPRYAELYWQWVRDGFMTLTDGDITDYGFVKQEIVQLSKRFGILELAIDRLFQGAQLATELQDDEGMNVIAHGQGFVSMAAPSKEFEEVVIEGKLEHGANPILRWMAGNVEVKVDEAANMKPVKPDHGRSPLKIDGIVASIMAISRWMARGNYEGQSVYETRGLRFL